MCFIKNNQEILLDLADFALKEKPEDNLMVTFSQAWYNGSYTMAAKPIKSLELHYTMIQFLIMRKYKTPFNFRCCRHPQSRKRSPSLHASMAVNHFYSIVMTEGAISLKN